MKRFFSFFFLLFSFGLASAVIIGVAPSQINFGQLESGSINKAKFTVFYPDAQNTKFIVTPSNNQEWFSFSKLESSSENKTVFELTLSIPKAAPGGNYTVLVYAKPVEEQNKSSGGAASISILPAVAIPVKFSVDGPPPAAGQSVSQQSAAPTSQAAKNGTEAKTQDNVEPKKAVDDIQKNAQPVDNKTQEAKTAGIPITGAVSLEQAAGYSTIILGVFAILLFVFLLRRK